jgi:TRAP-type C4-dicarboxylate transport system permease small subunit
VLEIASESAVMDLLVRGVGTLSKVFGVLAAICLTAACAVVCQMVLVRYVLGTSTIWQTEFVLYSIVAATLLGSPYVLATRGHVNVDLLPGYLGPRGRRALEAFAGALGVSFCALLGWSGWQHFHEAWAFGWVTESVWAPPLWIVLLPLPFGVGLLTIQYLVDLACLVTGYDRRHVAHSAPIAAAAKGAE